MNKKRRALVSACSKVLRQNLAVKHDEFVLILTDAKKREIASYFVEASGDLSQHIELVEVEGLTFNGQEPDAGICDKMLQADVILIPMSRSLSWTSARMRATENGARIASMPQITEEIMLRTFILDYYPIRARVNRIADWFDAADSARITTKLGTDLKMNLTGRKGRGRKGGIYTEPGYWGNLPCGEAFIAPVEEDTEGVYYVDASHAGIGRIDVPVCIEVNNGLATSITGGEQANTLKGMLEAVGNPLAFNIAEFGIGCNDSARVTGISLEDEKALGTCHIALGSNEFFGGTVSAGVHVDGVIKFPTIWFDDIMIMRDGVLVC